MFHSTDRQVFTGNMAEFRDWNQQPLKQPMNLRQRLRNYFRTVISLLYQAKALKFYFPQKIKTLFYWNQIILKKIIIFLSFFQSINHEHISSLFALRTEPEPWRRVQVRGPPKYRRCICLFFSSCTLRKKSKYSVKTLTLTFWEDNSAYDFYKTPHRHLNELVKLHFGPWLRLRCRRYCHKGPTCCRIQTHPAVDEG